MEARRRAKKKGPSGKEGPFVMTDIGTAGRALRGSAPMASLATQRSGGGSPPRFREGEARQSTMECRKASFSTGGRGPAAFSSLKDSSAASIVWSMSASVMAVVMNMLCQGWK